jgi:flavin-dependent dehydrogenase
MISAAPDCEVAIIGGGLGGLSLSILLAEAGKKVALFEKKKYPFHRVCGEYVAMESWPFLQRLGIPLSEMQLPRINQLRVTSLSGKMMKLPLTPGGFGISRYTLDALLCEQAKKWGVSVMENHVVKETDEVTGYSVVAGAFGKRSGLDKSLKRAFIQKNISARNWVGVKYHLRGNWDDDCIELHNFRGGYCGISKVEAGKYCCCYLTEAKNLRQCDGSIRWMEEQILSENKYLKEIFSRRENFFF